MSRIAGLFLVFLSSVALAGCASAPAAVQQPIHDGDTVAIEAAELREQQYRLLHQYDNALSAATQICPQLCQHHTAICALATRICGISKGHPGHVRALDLCEHANETCRETSLRLPKDCFCSDSGE